MFPFLSREEHLRQRAARGWTEDEDVLVCIVEIDRLRAAHADVLSKVATAFDEYLWGLSISPQPASGPCEESVRYFRDSLIADLAPEETEAIERRTDHARNKALANWEPSEDRP